MNKTIAKPVNGETTRVSILSGQAITLPFDAASATIEREDNDLVFSVPGGRVALQDFFALDKQALPSFTLTDGSVIAGDALLAALDADDLLTAAGPANGLLGSSGTYFENEGAGTIEGVDKLSALGTPDAAPHRTAPAPSSGVASSAPGGIYGQMGGAAAPDAGSAESTALRQEDIFGPQQTAGGSAHEATPTPAQETTLQAGQQSGDASGENAPHSTPDATPGTDTDNESQISAPGGAPDNEPGNEPATEPETEPGNEPGDEPETEPANEPGDEPGTEPANEPGDAPGTEPGNEPASTETSDYNVLFVVQLNTMSARLWNDGTEATADFGGYKTALTQVQGLLDDFCSEMQGTGAGTVSFGAVMFAASNAHVRQIGPIAFDADDPESVLQASAILQQQFDAIMGQGFYDSGSNFEAAFEAAAGYVDANRELWSNPDCENKVMFISNGQASASNFAANYEGEGKIGWLNKGNVTGDGKEQLSTSNSISSTQHHKVTANGVSDVIEHNEFQAAVDTFNDFVNFVNGLGGSSVDVHALGIVPNYGNAGVGSQLQQYQQEVLSFFDNTGSANVYEGDSIWTGKASSSASSNTLFAEGVQAEASFVHNLSLIAKQLVSTVTGEEYSARGLSATDVASGDYAANDENAIYFLDGKVDAAFGDGDNILYLGAGKSAIELGDGDNYVDFVYYNTNTVTAGGGNNHLHINGTGNKVTLSVGAEEGQGNDTVTVTGDSNTINTGSGNDLLFINSNGNKLELGDGHDTVVLDFKTATVSGETVFINGANTISDFKLGDDVLDISKIIDVVSEKSGQDLDLQSYLDRYVDVSWSGNDLRITLNHAEDVEGHRRGTGKNGEDWSYNYKIDGGGVTAQSELVLQNFAENNPDISTDLDASTLQALFTILHG